MNELLSVIVPIYNVESYLKKCIDSIIKQTYKNLEIILVDDGSPDKCGIMCDEYASMDERIKVIHKENGGLSDARNAGLDIMTGKYVAFVDSDDWIEDTMYECLIKNMERFGADISYGGVADDLEENGEITTIKKSKYGVTDFSEETIEAMKRYFLGSWATWDKVYRASVFMGVRFPVGEINEDEAIVLRLLNKCKTVCYTNQICYHYMKRENSNSITMSSFSEKKLVWVKHCVDNLKYIKVYYPNLEKYAALRYRRSLLWAINEIALLDNWYEYKTEINSLIKSVRNNKSLRKISYDGKKESIRYSIICYCGFNIYRRFVIGFKKLKKVKNFG